MEKQEVEIDSWKYQVIIDESKKFRFNIEPNNSKSEPQYLCKYYSLNEENVEALVESYFYASHPFQLNDAFDCYRELIDIKNLSLEDFKRILSPIYSEKDIEYYYNNNKDFLSIIFLDNVILKRLYAHFGILSLTENHKDYIMWSYYSGKNGFVIRFNIAAFPDAFQGPYPVNYVDKFKKIDFTLGSHLSVLYQTNIKSSKWRHEKEWRYIIFNNNQMKVPGYEKYQDNPHNRKFNYNQFNISDIILGYSFFPDQYLVKSKDNKYEFRFDENNEKCKLILKVLNWICDNLHVKTSIIALSSDNKFHIETKNIKIGKIDKSNYYFQIFNYGD